MSVPGNELIAKVMMFTVMAQGIVALFLLSDSCFLCSRRTVAADHKRNHDGQSPSFGAHGPRRQKN